MNKEKILGIDCLACTYSELKSHVDDDIKNNRKSLVIAINPEKIMKARKDEKLKSILNNATYQIPDGIGVIIASKIKRGSIKNRITGIDSMEMLLSLAQEKKYKVFMYGAKKQVISVAKQKIKEKYKGINIVGIIDGYEKDNDKIIEKIKKSKADILFVALGSPKQEEWIYANMSKVDVKIFQGVGGSFDVLSGNIKRAPIWMQKAGLEWLYRLIKEPKRIFRQFNLFKFLFVVLFSRKK